MYLVQGVTESVKVYDTYYSKNALVQAENGVLRISSFQKKPLTVAVYVTNLNTIEVADQSSVTTSGKASFLSLDVLLKDNARADINANVVSMYTTLKGNASLKLSGSAQEHTSVLASYAQLNLSQFTAQNSSVISQSAPLMSANNTSKALSEVFSLAGLAEIEK
ncbi:putative auto-transporter adhesin, head GIN domain [compost metagenome]